jgi:hypothetical protein
VSSACNFGTAASAIFGGVGLKITTFVISQTVHSTGIVFRIHSYFQTSCITESELTASKITELECFILAFSGGFIPKYSPIANFSLDSYTRIT